MRQCWNWQTGTFEGRVSSTYGFKSRLPHQSELLKSRRYAVSEVFFLSNNGFGHYLVIVLSFASSNNYAGFSTGIFVFFSRCIRFIILLSFILICIGRCLDAVLHKHQPFCGKLADRHFRYCDADLQRPLRCVVFTFYFINC